MAKNIPEQRCKRLVLDAGPLLSLSPLRGLADTYFTVPQILAELKDNHAREHFERLGLMSGVKVEVRSPDPASLSHVIQWSKKTGDYSVLSHSDLCVLALTFSLHEEDKRENERLNELEASAPTVQEAEQISFTDESHLNPTAKLDNLAVQLEGISLDSIKSESIRKVSTTDDEEEPLDVELTHIGDEEPTNPPSEELTPSRRMSPTPIYDDPSDSDDGEGEWITPSNVAIHKSRALNLLPGNELDGKHTKKNQLIRSGCMTADFAMQNVLLQMGLNLIGLEGKRIEKVKNWVLRCHACFKICMDNSKKFCPSCGNPTLLRASVTVASPTASANAPAMQVHLKPNFQYKIRGTKYSIPAPKPGSAKTGPGTGLILREDQAEYIRAKKVADGKREREEKRLTKGILGRASSTGESAGIGSWMDPDWLPEIARVGSGGRGRTIRNSRMDGDMPQIGHGRKNPNEMRRKK